MVKMQDTGKLVGENQDQRCTSKESCKAAKEVSGDPAQKER